MATFNDSSIATLNSTPVALTDGEIWFQLIFSYGIIGVISAILHLLIAIVVVTTEHLRSRFFVFIFFLSIARLLYAISHIMLSLFRSLRTVGVVDAFQTSLTCHSVQIFTFVAGTMDLLLLLLMLVDRVIAFLYPMTYRNLSTKQAIRMCLIAYLACFLLRFLPSYAGVSTSKMVTCINSAFAVLPEYTTYAKYLDFGLSIAILLAYIALFWAIRHRLGKKSDGQTQIQDASIKKSMKIMPFLRLQLIMHFCLIMTSRLIQVIGDLIGSGTPAGQRLQAYYGQICSIDVLANAVIFYWRHPDLWCASVQILCGRRAAGWFESKEKTRDASAIGQTIAPPHPSPVGQVAPIQVNVQMKSIVADTFAVIDH